MAFTSFRVHRPLIWILLCAAVPAQSRVGEYMNPLDVSGADPQILKDGDTYYLYQTTASDAGFEVYSSKDLVNWRGHGFCFQEDATTWAQNDFWAPEVIKAGDTYYLYYTGRGDVRSICVATSDSPLGPFEDVTAPMLPSLWSLDASPFHDEISDRWYLYYVDQPRKTICVGELAPDLLTLDGPTTDCFTGTETWEGSWVEGPYVVKHQDTYYMTYSVGSYNHPSYRAGYATAPSPVGPWTKPAGNPILRAAGTVSGPGHNSIIESPDGSELFIAYHSHVPPFVEGQGWQRQLNIDRINFLPGGSGPDVLKLIDGPTLQAKLLPSGAAPRPLAVSDEFDGPELDFGRWMTFGENRDKWRLEEGKLKIETQDGDLWTNRIDAKNLFMQHAPRGDFKIQTKVHFKPLANFEQAFLIVFQDQSNYIKVSSVFTNGRAYETVREIDGEFYVSTIRTAPPDEVHLQIEKAGNHYTLSRSSDGANWTAFPGGFDADFGEIKVGVGAFSPGSGATRTATFDFFRIEPLNPSPVGVTDYFDRLALDRDLWLIHNETVDNWTQGEGKLTITTEEGEVRGARDDARNVFLQRAPEGDFEIIANVDFAPQANGEQAFVTIWDDHDNYVRLSTVYDEGAKLEASYEAAGSFSRSQIENVLGSQLLLRITKRSSRYRFDASADGTNWMPVGDGYTFSAMPLKIGLGATAAGSGMARAASFDSFEVVPLATTAERGLWKLLH